MTGTKPFSSQFISSNQLKSTLSTIFYLGLSSLRASESKPYFNAVLLHIFFCLLYCKFTIVKNARSQHRIGTTITVLAIMISVVEDVSRPTLTARAG